MCGLVARRSSRLGRREEHRPDSKQRDDNAGTQDGGGSVRYGTVGTGILA